MVPATVAVACTSQSFQDKRRWPGWVPGPDGETLAVMAPVLLSQRVAACGVTTEVAPTGVAEGVAQGPVRVQVPGVGALDPVGGVEDEAAQPIWMAHGERLAEEGAVGVAVEVDPFDGQRVEHGGEVVRCLVAPLEV